MTHHIDEEGFWRKVGHGAPRDCWFWKGKVDRDGYGRHFMGGKWHLAHRVAYRLTRGDTPPVVIHSCDNPSCCNPRHLRGGTQQENMEDRQRKGRQPKGSKNGRAKLNEEAVAQIKQLLQDELLSQAEIARRFGISKYVIYDINVGKTWRHVRPAAHAVIYEINSRKAA